MAAIPSPSLVLTTVIAKSGSLAALAVLHRYFESVSWTLFIITVTAFAILLHSFACQWNCQCIIKMTALSHIYLTNLYSYLIVSSLSCSSIR